MKLLLFLAILAAPAGKAFEQSSPYGRLYVFGDSYSDTGAGYLDGNGPTAVAYLAKRMGIELVPANVPDSKGKSLNFSVSGARTDSGEGRHVKEALLGLGMKNQVDDFANRVRSRNIVFDSQKTLFFLAGGLNDGRLPTETTVDDIMGMIRTLHSLGARQFRVALLPTAIPSFSEVGKRLNPALAQIPEEMTAELGDSKVAVSKWGVYFDEVMQNPAHYGIANTTDRCAGRVIFNEDATPCSKPETYYYYHAGHPSTAVHRIVGDKLYEELLEPK